MSASTSTANRNVKKQATPNAKTGQKSRDTSQHSIKSKTNQSGKLSSRRVTPSPHDSEEADTSLSDEIDFQGGSKSNKKNTTTKKIVKTNINNSVTRDSGNNLSVSSKQSAPSTKKPTSLNSRSSTRRTRDTENDANDEKSASKNISRPLAERQVIDNFDTPSGDISASKSSKSAKQNSQNANSSVKAKSGVNIDISSSKNDKSNAKNDKSSAKNDKSSAKNDKSSAKSSVKNDKSSAKANGNNQTDDSNILNDDSSSKSSKSNNIEEEKMVSYSGARHIQLPATDLSESDHSTAATSQNPSASTSQLSQRKSNSKTSSKLSAEIEKAEEEEDFDEANHQHGIKFRANPEKLSDTESRASSRSSSIGVLLLSKQNENQEGIISLHSRSNSPKRSPAAGNIQARNGAFDKAELGSNAQDMILKLPDKARINEKVGNDDEEEDSVPPPRFGSNIGSSGAKESDDESRSSSIKPPDEDSYSDSMSPLSSSTDPTYSYLDEVPQPKINLSKITNSREIYIPDQTYESGYMCNDPIGQEFMDTDDEPSITNPEQTKKELFAEIDKPVADQTKSATCLLI